MSYTSTCVDAYIKHSKLGRPRDGFGLGPRPEARGPDRLFKSPARPEPDILGPSGPRAGLELCLFSNYFIFLYFFKKKLEKVF